MARSSSRGFLGNVVDAAKAEYKRQPISFLLSIAGGVALLYSAVAALPAVISPLNIKPLDLSVILKASGFVVVQGTLAALVVRMQAAIAKLGHGMPIVLAMLIAVVGSWLSEFISFWIVVPNSTSWGWAMATFIGASLASLGTFAYFGTIYLERDPAITVSLALFAEVVVAIGLFVFGVSFALQIDEYLKLHPGAGA